MDTNTINNRRFTRRRPAGAGLPPSSRIPETMADKKAGKLQIRSQELKSEGGAGGCPGNL
jgi:hypothetical protein